MFVSKEQIETLVGTKIKDLSLYQRAFTHKSALKEYEQFTESFETLEFMGDSVLGFIITKFLFDRHEEKTGRISHQGSYKTRSFGDPRRYSPKVRSQ